MCLGQCLFSFLDYLPTQFCQHLTKVTHCTHNQIRTQEMAKAMSPFICIRKTTHVVSSLPSKMKARGAFMSSNFLKCFQPENSDKKSNCNLEVRQMSKVLLILFCERSLGKLRCLFCYKTLFFDSVC